MTAQAPHLQAPTPPRPKRLPESYGGGVFAGAVGAFLLLVAPGWFAAPFFGYFAYRTARVAIVRRRFEATDALTVSYQAIAAGQFLAAEIAIDHALRRFPVGWVQRNAAIQRAVIAIRRGEAAEAKQHLDVALAAPRGRFEPKDTEYQIEGAHAIRAFACASLGMREEAANDIAYVRGRKNASVEALAKVGLAEAMILERSGERDALKALLDRDRELLLEHTHPRERAILRAYQRMLKVSSTSVYRYKGTRDDEAPASEEPALADWVAKIAPSAAPFVRVARKGAGGGEGEDLSTAGVPFDAQSAAAVQHQRSYDARAAAPKARVGRVFAAIGAGIVGTAALGMLSEWVFVRMVNDGPPSATDMTGYYVTSAPLLGILGVVIAFATAWAIRANARKKAQRDLADARRVSEVLGDLTQSEDAVVAAKALAMIANREERNARFDVVASASGRAIGRLLGDVSRAVNAGLLWPELVSMHAFALAAMGNSAQANAELASLPSAYPHRARALYRVRLAALSRAGRWREAAAWVESHALDLPLSVREELLGDLVRAVAEPEHAGLGETDRLREELRTSPENVKWIETIAPGLVAAFNGEDPSLDARARIEVAVPVEAPAAAPPYDARERDAQMEADAALEAEAFDARRRA